MRSCICMFSTLICQWLVGLELSESVYFFQLSVWTQSHSRLHPNNISHVNFHCLTQRDAGLKSPAVLKERSCNRSRLRWTKQSNAQSWRGWILIDIILDDTDPYRLWYRSLGSAWDISTFNVSRITLPYILQSLNEDKMIRNCCCDKIPESLKSAS